APWPSSIRPAGMSRVACSWIGSRRREAPDDLARGLDARDPAHAASRLPIVPRRVAREVTALEPPRRLEPVNRAHEMLRPAVPQHPACKQAGLGADALDVRRSDHRERDSGDALREHDIVLVRLDDRALLV